MRQGASKPWTEIMEEMTGQPKMDSRAMRSYFKPLEDWLIKENRRTGAKIGWEDGGYEKYCNKD